MTDLLRTKIFPFSGSVTRTITEHPNRKEIDSYFDRSILDDLNVWLVITVFGKILWKVNMRFSRKPFWGVLFFLCDDGKTHCIILIVHRYYTGVIIGGGESTQVRSERATTTTATVTAAAAATAVTAKAEV